MRLFVLFTLLSWFSVPHPGPSSLLTLIPITEEAKVLQTDPLLLFIPISGETEIQFFNAQGESVLAWMRENVPAGLLKPKITTEFLPQGVYVIMIRCSDRVWYQKLLIRGK